MLIVSLCVGVALNFDCCLVGWCFGCLCNSVASFFYFYLFGGLFCDLVTCFVV